MHAFGSLVEAVVPTMTLTLASILGHGELNNWVHQAKYCCWCAPWVLHIAAWRGQVCSMQVIQLLLKSLIGNITMTILVQQLIEYFGLWKQMGIVMMVNSSNTPCIHLHLNLANTCACKIVAWSLTTGSPGGTLLHWIRSNQIIRDIMSCANILVFSTAKPKE